MTMMRASLPDLFAGLTPAKVPAISVCDLTSDSRRAAKGGLFLACSGAGSHGLDYVGDALEAGVVAVAWDPAAGAAPLLPDNVAGVEVAGLDAHVGCIADRFFAAPSKQIVVTGITGTNGKTTTAWLASEALGQLAGKTAYMGTLGYGVLPELESTTLTTPGCIAVHRRLREMADQGVRNLVMEVSSHALDQGRIDGVRVQTAAFTNLSRDHLDYHGDMASYKAAKAKLFEAEGLNAAVINIGDDFGAELAAQLGNRLRLITVSLDDRVRKGATADLSATCREVQTGGLYIEFSGSYGEAAMHSSLWGGFNAENLLVAVGILIAQGASLDEAVSALDAGSVPPGRMQVVGAEGDNPAVIIDFAHTPDALAQALQTARQHVGGRVVCVFGCGGNRDAGKRGEMGEVAGRYADHIVVTSDNPRDEDPLAIIEAVVAGIAANESYEVIPDRREAITRAIQGVGAGDAVLVAGKGSENYQVIAGRTEVFSDLAVAREALGAGS
jgi:UDP-N-acetylmuramoyl-L-alanyl-D-glutamate--2,6-diaminopimelate ligase